MRLLSLICLRCAAALPDIGVTYAATGRLNVLMATESVRQLSTRYAHIHTLRADDHATCDRLRGGAPWKCVDVTSGTSHAALHIYDTATFRCFLSPDPSHHHRAGITDARWAADGARMRSRRPRSSDCTNAARLTTLSVCSLA